MKRIYFTIYLHLYLLKIIFRFRTGLFGNFTMNFSCLIGCVIEEEVAKDNFSDDVKLLNLNSFLSSFCILL